MRDKAILHSFYEAFHKLIDQQLILRHFQVYLQEDKPLNFLVFHLIHRHCLNLLNHLLLIKVLLLIGKPKKTIFKQQHLKDVHDRIIPQSNKRLSGSTNSK